MSRQEGYSVFTTKVARVQSIPWWVFLAQGVSLIIVGLLFLTTPVLPAIYLLAIYFLSAGVLELVSLFINHSTWGLKLLGGIIGIWASIIILSYPLEGPTVPGSVAMILLGIQAVMLGVINIIQSYRGADRGIGLLGVINGILGATLLVYSAGAIDTLPLLLILGALSVTGGVMTIVHSFRIREAHPILLLEIDGSSFSLNDDQRDWSLTITHPKCLAKGSTSSFIASIHQQVLNSLVQRNAIAKLQARGVSDVETSSFGFVKSKISLVVTRLESPHISFLPSEGVIFDITENSFVFQTDFVAVPNKDAPVRRTSFVRASLTEKLTGEEILSGVVTVRIDDYLVDSMSRPIIAKAVAAVSTTCSVVLWVLVFLEQIDKTFGFTAGAASLFLAGLLGLGTYFRYSSTVTTDIP